MGKKSRTEYSALNIITGLGGYALNTVVCRMVFTRTLSAEYLGVSGLFTNILSMLSLAELGIGSAIMYALYKPLAVDDKEKVASLVKFYGRCYRVIGVVVAVIGAALMPFLHLLIEKPNIQESIYLLYGLYLFNAASTYFFSYRASLLMAAQQNYIVTGVSYIITVVQRVLQIIWLFATHHYIGYLIIQCVGGFVYNIIVSYIARKEYILEYMEYTGCTVNFKTYANSIWDKKQRENPMENRKIFYNTHPAIISLEVFDKVQEIRQQRHRRTATGKSNMFSGLVFCNDCKQKLYYSTTSYFEKRQDFFICSTHRANKDKRSGHYIRAVVLEQIVWKHIQEVVSVVTRYEAYFRSEMEQKLRIQSEESLRLYQKRLAQAEKRIGELDRLFIRIYEDNVAGRLDDERFAMMSKNYTEEQKDLKAEVKNLQLQIREQEQQADNIEQFVQRVKRNSTLTELTPYALRELVKAVYVDAPDKSSGKRRQKVHIEYDLVGYIPVDELLKAEQA